MKYVKQGFAIQLADETDKDYLLRLIGLYPTKYSGFLKSLPHISEQIRKLPYDSQGERIYRWLNPLVLGICKQCGTNTKFVQFSEGYREFCSCSCRARALNSNRNGLTIEAIEKKKQIYSSKKRFTPHLIEKSLELRKQTLLSKYGTLQLSTVPEIEAKTLETLWRKHQRTGPNQENYSQEVYDKLMSRDWMYEQHVVLMKPLEQIKNELGLSCGRIIHRFIKKHKIQQQYYTTRSYAEIEISNFVKALYAGPIVSNDRSLISPKELDIVLPDLKIAIEYCGLFWHNDRIVSITPRTHLHKLESMTKLGYRLIQIFEDEWIHKRTLVEEKIARLLGQSKQRKIFARKCLVGLVNIEDRDRFFEANHIQGTTNSSVAIGLYFETALVALVTFIQRKPRVYELVRYATNARVNGGLGKLLSYFKQNYAWTSIYSFADRRWSTGDMYYKLGFKLVKILPPDYMYKDGDRRVHKFNYRHSRLKNKLANYDPTLSETENTYNHGILRIWNCGLLKFEILNIK